MTLPKGEEVIIQSLELQVALAVCPRLGLTSEETETVSWLVLHHLLMSKMLSAMI